LLEGVGPSLTRLLVDTDVFAKLGIAGLFERLYTLFGVTANQCSRLPALPHMLRRGALPALYGKEQCDRLLPIAESMPVAPNASTAWLSRFASVPQIDPGEAQLFASAAEHQLYVVTGDKRAVVAAAKVEGMADALGGRVAPMEAVLLSFCQLLGRDRVREAVRPLITTEDRKEKMLRVCFSEGNPDPESALRSYINDLKRSAAPLVLWGVQHEGASNEV
jgi:hypothetical protein